ncbi:hypothetical protein AVEN_214736-1 [Araneus ventricosus]|uniref:Uncharacterized protein n=1 Tax=Araneus ventricosus TaxID=182803 RepID=A0A4Y2IFG3_ARAVE|nr:hypothetical protein AVEN_214736-1 [Araneus ventricosus]
MIVNTLTPKPAVTGLATFILVGRISAGCCSERGEKAVGRVAIKGNLKREMKGLLFISSTTRSEKKRENEADESIPRIIYRVQRVKSTQVGETDEQRGRMTMSLNACAKRKHPPDIGSFDKVPPEERMANYPVVSPSKARCTLADSCR